MSNVIKMKPRQDRFAGYFIPEHTKGALIRYIDEHLMPGGFLYAVLSNNLFVAVATADSDNIVSLHEITTWIYNNAPGTCYGSEAHVKAWLANK